MAKRGRPHIENPREKSYRIRMNEDECEQLEYLANITGRTKSAVLRDLISNCYAEEKKRFEN